MKCGLIIPTTLPYCAVKNLGRSIITVPVDLADFVMVAWNAGEKSILALLDICNAFDIVDMQHLLSKLVSYSFDCNSIKCFTSYLGSRIQRVDVSSGDGSPLLLVPQWLWDSQGSSLEPLLFNL